MDESVMPQFSISEQELIGCASIVEARFEDPELEAARLELTRRFLRGALAAESALRVHNRCAVVNHCGTHGTSNLAEISQILIQALSSYAALVRETARLGMEASTAVPDACGPRLVREVA